MLTFFIHLLFCCWYSPLNSAFYFLFICSSFSTKNFHNYPSLRSSHSKTIDIFSLSSSPITFLSFPLFLTLFHWQKKKTKIQRNTVQTRYSRICDNIVVFTYDIHDYQQEKFSLSLFYEFLFLNNNFCFLSYPIL